jgi:hypothetical protein
MDIFVQHDIHSTQHGNVIQPDNLCYIDQDGSLYTRQDLLVTNGPEKKTLKIIGVAFNEEVMPYRDPRPALKMQHREKISQVRVLRLLHPIDLFNNVHGDCDEYLHWRDFNAQVASQRLTLVADPISQDVCVRFPVIDVNKAAFVAKRDKKVAKRINKEMARGKQEKKGDSGKGFNTSKWSVDQIALVSRLAGQLVEERGASKQRKEQAADKVAACGFGPADEDLKRRLQGLVAEQRKSHEQRSSWDSLPLDGLIGLHDRLQEDTLAVANSITPRDAGAQSKPHQTPPAAKRQKTDGQGDNGGAAVSASVSGSAPPQHGAAGPEGLTSDAKKARRNMLQYMHRLQSGLRIILRNRGCKVQKRLRAQMVEPPVAAASSSMDQSSEQPPPAGAKVKVPVFLDPNPYLHQKDAQKEALAMQAVPIEAASAHTLSFLPWIVARDVERGAYSGGFVNITQAPASWRQGSIRDPDQICGDPNLKTTMFTFVIGSDSARMLVVTIGSEAIMREFERLNGIRSALVEEERIATAAGRLPEASRIKIKTDQARESIKAFRDRMHWQGVRLLGSFPLVVLPKFDYAGTMKGDLSAKYKTRAQNLSHALFSLRLDRRYRGRVSRSSSRPRCFHFFTFSLLFVAVILSPFSHFSLCLLARSISCKKKKPLPHYSLSTFSPIFFHLLQLIKTPQHTSNPFLLL